MDARKGRTQNVVTMEPNNTGAGGFDVLRTAAQQQARFTAEMADLGYKTFTTFYGDLTIAEAYGPDGVRETYDRVNRDWRGNYRYYTVFVLALNHKIWEHYYKKNETFERLYNDLWTEADLWVGNNWTGEAAAYYFEITD